MTSQTKKYIEFSDILSLCCECKHGNCSTSLSVPLEGVSGKELRYCPKCAESWVDLGGSSFEQLFTELATKIRRIKESQAHLGCAITLEIRDEQSGEKK